MDRVRLGRALGRGARHAAQTAIEAAEAATAPATNRFTPAASQGRIHAETAGTHSPRSSSRPQTLDAAPTRTRPYDSLRAVSHTSSAVVPAARAAAAGVMGPLRNASRALWHELTGSFFALFAFSFAAGAWHTHTLARSAMLSDRYRFGSFCALALLFAYFSISSFVRAKRRH